MESARDIYPSQQGMTFIELLIVLVIVGMGWFTLMPNLDLAGDDEADALSQVNSLVYRARTAAVADDTRQSLSIDFEEGAVFWGEVRKELPAPVSSGHFNEQPLGGEGVEFFIYPEGFCDEVRLVLDNGMTLILDVLSARFVEM